MGSKPFRRLMFLGAIFCAPIIAVAQHFDSSLEVLPAGSSLQSASYQVPGAEATSSTGHCNARGCAACAEGRSASWFDWDRSTGMIPARRIAGGAGAAVPASSTASVHTAMIAPTAIRSFESGSTPCS